jgi:hypothetical protein
MLASSLRHRGCVGGADIEVLPNGLEAFNESRWPGHQPWRPLAVFARDRESIVVGLAGETYSGWLFIRLLPQVRLRGVRRTGHHARAKAMNPRIMYATAAMASGAPPAACRPSRSQTRRTGRDAGSSFGFAMLIASSLPNIRAH